MKAGHLGASDSRRMVKKIRVTVAVALGVLVATTALNAPAYAHEDHAHENDVSPPTPWETDAPKRVYADVQFSELPQVVSTPTPFSATATHPDGVPACSATFGGVTQECPGPWSFTFDPSAIETTFKVVFCDGTIDDRRRVADPAFILGGPRNPSVTSENDSNNPTIVWTVTNNLDLPARAEVIYNDTVLVAADIPAQGSQMLKTKLKSKDFKRGNNPAVIQVTAGDGTAQTFNINIAKGWASIFGNGYMKPTFAPCSTVTWSYSTKGQPKNSKKMRSTVRKSFDILSKRTGLKFVEDGLNNPEADIRFSWEKLRGWAGLGGTDGSIVLARDTFWTRDAYAGHGKKGRPGNGWLVIHEALHVLGLGHADIDGELMSSADRKDRAGFGKGDLAGIEAMYRPKSCR